MEILGKPRGDLTRKRPLRSISLQKIIRLNKTLRNFAKWQELSVRVKKNFVNVTVKKEKCCKFVTIKKEKVYKMLKNLVKNCMEFQRTFSTILEMTK